MSNVTEFPCRTGPRAVLERTCALKTFELMEAVKNGALVLSPKMTASQRTEATRELRLIAMFSAEYMKDERNYFASMHFDPPADYRRDEEVGGAA